MRRDYFKYLTSGPEIPEKEKTKNWQRRQVRSKPAIACWNCGKPLKRDNTQHLCVECAVEN